MSRHDSLWRERLTAYLQAQANPVHKYGHQPRLYALTEQIAAASPGLVYDDDVVFAAAFLHDLGVFVGHRPEDSRALASWDHVAYVCDRAPALLDSFGFPADKIHAVLRCMREHQPHDTPGTPEATLLRDADILEQLGAIGVLRTAAKLGSDTRFLHFTDAQRSLRRALETLPDKLRTEGARSLAQPRLQALQAFLQALTLEAGENLH